MSEDRGRFFEELDKKEEELTIKEVGLKEKLMKIVDRLAKVLAEDYKIAQLMNSDVMAMEIDQFINEMLYEIVWKLMEVGYDPPSCDCTCICNNNIKTNSAGLHKILEHGYAYIRINFGNDSKNNS